MCDVPCRRVPGGGARRQRTAVWVLGRGCVCPSSVRRLHLAHPLGVKAFSYRRVKNDQRDASDLSDLLRDVGRLPHAWIAPPETRELRELVCATGQNLVAMRSQCKAHVHAVLAKGGSGCRMTDLFAVEGNLLLGQSHDARTVQGADRLTAAADRGTRLRDRPVTNPCPGPVGLTIPAYTRHPADPRHRARAGGGVRSPRWGRAPLPWPRPVDLLGRTDALPPRIRHHGAPRPDHQTRLAPGAVGGNRIGANSAGDPAISAASEKRSPTGAATATSAPWPRPENSSNSSTTGYGITTSGTCNRSPQRGMRQHNSRSGADRAGHDPETGRGRSL